MVMMGSDKQIAVLGGNIMSDLAAEVYKPLHGDYTYGLKVSTNTGERTLAHLWRAHELGRCERIKSVAVDDAPGVKQYELYETRYDAQNHPKPLEVAEAEAKNPPIQVLISRMGNVAIVSSRIGHNETGFVAVPPPSEYSNVKSTVDQIDLVDYATIPNHDLMAAHLRRLAEHECDPAEELPQLDADNIFRVMVSGLSEVD